MGNFQSREFFLSAIVTGDLFFGIDPVSGATLICLTTDISAKVISGRRVTTSENLRFDRLSGHELDGTGVITSVSPLPNDVHNVMLGIDRKMRLSLTWEDFKLNAEERERLVQVQRFWKDHPLPIEVSEGPSEKDANPA